MRVLVTLCCLLFPFFYLSTTASATSWVYPFVVYDGFIYVVEEEATEVKVEERIGEVTAYSDMHQYEGNFSNVFEKGTDYYKIAGHPTTQVIAVEVREGVFRKAEREAAYTYVSEGQEATGSFQEKGKPVERKDLIFGTGVFVSFLAFVAGTLYLFQRKGT
ncbi:hypothetical protein LC065_12390 [Halobacillus litoralis]|uniref:hypothetical protein n=1 Tax=Halobacillus litoralis TaxID=45668 RepID=UPI001CFEB106|nr:hypothetical protein [Halobacillus litoralis]WLR46380.1 hypothetical protein LC065_12390 [Halobacillus litoralis]